MHPRLFRLIEKHQRIDEMLRVAQRRADPREIDRLRGLKMRAKRLIHRLTARPAFS